MCVVSLNFKRVRHGLDTRLRGRTRFGVHAAKYFSYARAQQLTQRASDKQSPSTSGFVLGLVFVMKTQVRGGAQSGQPTCTSSTTSTIHMTYGQWLAILTEPLGVPTRSPPPHVVFRMRVAM
jgi:hypothetical protein